VLDVAVLLQEVLDDGERIGVGLCQLEEGMGDSILQYFVAAVAHEHHQLCGEVDAVLERDVYCYLLFLQEMVDGLRIGLEVVDAS
jgi:hypothetical protein